MPDFGVPILPFTTFCRTTIRPATRWVGAQEFTWDFEPLISLEALRSLDLSGATPGPLYRPIAAKEQSVLPALRELSLGMRFDEQPVEAAAQAFGRQLDTLHWSGRYPPGATIKERPRGLVAGDAHVGAHVDGEFVVGRVTPWMKRPLEFGDEARGPWFEGGGVAVANGTPR